MDTGPAAYCFKVVGKRSGKQLLRAATVSICASVALSFSVRILHVSCCYLYFYTAFERLHLFSKLQKIPSTECLCSLRFTNMICRYLPWSRSCQLSFPCHFIWEHPMSCSCSFPELKRSIFTSLFRCPQLCVHQRETQTNFE